MALNLSKVTEVSVIPSRVRGSVSDTEREEIYKEFDQLIDLAKGSDKGMVAVRIEGAAECAKYGNALAACKTAHPSMWACLSTAGGEYEEGTKKQLAVTLYAAARPQERKLESLKKAGIGAKPAAAPAVMVRKPAVPEALPFEQSDEIQTEE